MSQKATELKVVKLTSRGEARVLDGKVGMTFIVDSWTQRVNTSTPDMVIYHVRDYRYASSMRGPWCIWTLSPGDYELVGL